MATGSPHPNGGRCHRTSPPPPPLRPRSTPTAKTRNAGPRQGRPTRTRQRQLTRWRAARGRSRPLSGNKTALVNDTPPSWDGRRHTRSPVSGGFVAGQKCSRSRGSRERHHTRNAASKTLQWMNRCGATNLCARWCTHKTWSRTTKQAQQGQGRGHMQNEGQARQERLAPTRSRQRGAGSIVAWSRLVVGMATWGDTGHIACRSADDQHGATQTLTLPARFVQCTSRRNRKIHVGAYIRTCTLRPRCHLLKCVLPRGYVPPLPLRNPDNSRYIQEANSRKIVRPSQTSQ